MYEAAAWQLEALDGHFATGQERRAKMTPQQAMDDILKNGFYAERSAPSARERVVRSGKRFLGKVFGFGK